MNILHADWYLKTSWKKKTVVIAIALIALVFLTSLLNTKGSQYATEPVTKDTVIDIVSESGNIASSRRFDVYATSTGYIEEVYVENGDTVSAAQKLFRVKSTASPQDQATAYTTYQNALSAEKTAEQNKQSLDATMWTKQQALLSARNNVNYKNDNTTNPSTKNNYTDLEKQAIDSALVQAQKDFSAAEQKYKEADVAITATKASISSTWLSYQGTQDVVITAPAPGTIANFSSSVGDKVSAASGTTTLTSASTNTPALIILGDPSKASMKIPLNEVDIDKVKMGQPATIVFDAFREKKYKGHIAAIDTAGTNTNGVITYNASVVIDNPDANIKTEMTATASIETAKHKDVLTVPNSAIKPYKGGKAVIVAGADKNSQVKNKAGQELPYHYVPVTIGLKGITKTEIIKGVTDGTLVITSSIN
jgi:multidrug efflux pump subunit AcrA (membrane-fusion protein)